MMTTVSIAAIIDDLCIAVDHVRAESALEWADALDAGWSWLLDQDVIQVDAHGALLVPSSRNPEMIYRANGVCQCEAYTKARGPLPCYHRGAGMIVERWRENVALEYAAAQAAQEEAYNALWWQVYEASPSPYHAIAHHEATEVVRSVRAAQYRPFAYTVNSHAAEASGLAGLFG